MKIYMAAKSSKLSKDSTGELYDAGRRHVLAEKIQPLPENLKKKISYILQVIPSRSKAEIAEVLQSCNYDVDAALNSFINTEDGAAMDHQNEWMVQGRRKNKNRKKSGKKQSKESNAGQGVPANKPADDESKPVEQQQNTKADQIPNCPTSNTSQTAPNSNELPLDPACSVEKPILINGELKDDPTKMSVPSSPSSSSVVSTSTVSEKSSPEGPSAAKPGHHNAHEKHPRVRTHSASGNEVIKKSLKDLQRSSVSISRFQSVLDEDAEMSTKALAKTFQTVRQALDEREKLLEEQLQNVIQETKNLLQERQEDAAGLKFKCNRVGTMSEDDAIELRNEIKHFVGERRIDEDLGTTKRFKGDEETIIEAIKHFGEVTPIKHHYTLYKKLKNAEPVKPKLEEKKPPPLKVVPPTVENKPRDKNESLKAGTKGRGSRTERPVVSPSRLKDQAEIHARLQEVVKQQTGSLLTLDKNKKVHFDEKSKSKDSTGTATKNLNDKRKTSQSNHQATASHSNPGSSPDRSAHSITKNTGDGVVSHQNGQADNKDSASNNTSSANNSVNGHEHLPNGDISKPNGSGHSFQSQGKRRTRRHYVRKPEFENGDAFSKNFSKPKEMNNEKPNQNQTGTTKSDEATKNVNGLPKGGQNMTAKNGADGSIPSPLPQRQRKTRKVYHRKNPEAEIQFPPPQDNVAASSSVNGQTSVE